MTKKIILLLVEGPTDEDALALVYSKLVREHDLEFDVLHTDITAGEDMTVKYIADRIQAEVAEYLRKHPYIVKEDILKVVQIIDTDGAFIPTSQIRQSDTGKTEYFDTYIAAKNKDRLIRRNISKRRIVYHLMKSEEVAGFPYEIYYFSRNLEHVLHDISEDLDDDAKEDLAYEIAMRYKDQPEEFLQFLYDDAFHVPGTYGETWEFIMDDGKSMGRYSNMAVFFERLGIAALKPEMISFE